mgnify:CR=1 FL=1
MQREKEKNLCKTKENNNINMTRKILCSMAAMLLSVMTMAQTLEKMQWFNEPESWEIKEGTLLMDVTPQSDYWRISHYGFTVDDAPFLYILRGGEFEVKVKVSGEYKTRFDNLVCTDAHKFCRSLNLQPFHFLTFLSSLQK